MCNVVIVNLGSYGMFVMEDSPIKRTAVYLGCSITLKPALGGSHSRNLFPEHLMPPGVSFHPMECQNPPFPVAHQHDDRNAASRVGPCHATRALTSSANLTGRQTALHSDRANNRCNENPNSQFISGQGSGGCRCH